MLKVRDIMTTDVVSLSKSSTVASATWRLESAEASGAPVRDFEGKVVGVLSKSDLMEPLLHNDMGKLVDDVMSHAVWSVPPDAPALQAVALMVEHKVHQVIVVQGPGKLEGILSTMDVLRAVLEGRDFHVASHPEHASHRAESGEKSAKH